MLMSFLFHGCDNMRFSYRVAEFMPTAFSVKDKIARQLRRCLAPTVGDASVDYSDLQEVKEIVQTPYVLPSVFQGELFTCYLFLQVDEQTRKRMGTKRITLHVRTHTKSKDQQSSGEESEIRDYPLFVNMQNITRGTLLHILAARSRVRYLSLPCILG
jgi:hypothetical protein